MDSGLIFGATYVVLEVVEENGHKLLQLRNPPGDHAEWQGDWGDSSELWTRYMKRKLNYSDDADDGCFWMSFDDFVSRSVRCLLDTTTTKTNGPLSCGMSGGKWMKGHRRVSLPATIRLHIAGEPPICNHYRPPNGLMLDHVSDRKGIPISEPLEAMFLLFKPPKPIGLAEAPTESVRVEKLEAKWDHLFRAAPS